VARVFVSHSGQDEQLCDEIVRWLRAEGHELFYDRDPMVGLVAGDRWRDLLFERLRWSVWCRRHMSPRRGVLPRPRSRSTGADGCCPY
jgi:hypothetical protein